MFRVHLKLKSLTTIKTEIYKVGRLAGIYFTYVLYINYTAVIFLCQNSSMKPTLKRGKMHSKIGNNLSFDIAIIILSSEMHDNSMPG